MTHHVEKCPLCGQQFVGDTRQEAETKVEIHNISHRMQAGIRDEPSALNTFPGTKNDSGKPRWDLLPWGPLEEVARVMEYGARKYAPDNWKVVPGARWRYLRAGLGHFAAFARGEERDPESGLSHLAHAVCCALFLMWFRDVDNPVGKLG